MSQPDPPADPTPIEPPRFPRPTTFVTVVMLVVALLVGLGVGGLLYTRRVHDQTATNTRKRHELELSNCIAANVRSQALRLALKDSLVTLIPPDMALTDDQKARIAAYNTTVDARLPFRDCSPEAIDDYLAHPPVDPAAPGGS